ncbi:aspartate aminotransferase family protein [Natronospira bacteriovora]|uniref:Aspartate aminotransferase family protein n=1 Tax=Natronospira bacteriovora TaxID=3069753 RepID=A0ABU0W6G7_9GAMM|nr:aspartate aminotransferase family protein [Natronospira sp. AB-CW4]MDQ2069591.1 aspartate aminotransferase family protein [Natronospira sp. AB-CW4]
MSMSNQGSALLETYAPYPFAIHRGAGSHVFDEHGQAWLDLYGGHCVALTGHCHPRLATAVAEQASTLGFYSMAARLPVRERAARALVDFAPEGLDQVFFCNSGAEANENALRVAAMVTGRSRFVAFEGGFHGRSQLALSVSDTPALHARAPGLQNDVSLLPFGDEDALAAEDLSGVAAVIVEPIQSMAGVREAPENWLARLRAQCDAAGTLLIFDEIQTGMGRLGRPFAADQYRVTPDLMSCAKGLASGLPMGALIMSNAVAAALGPGDLGSTFGGGPVACAALLATLGVIEEEDLPGRARLAEAAIRRGLSGSVVRRVRGRGLLLGLELTGAAAPLKDWLARQHILVGASADPSVLRLMPPLSLEPSAIRALTVAVHAFSHETNLETQPSVNADGIQETQPCSI